MHGAFHERISIMDLRQEQINNTVNTVRQRNLGRDLAQVSFPFRP